MDIKILHQPTKNSVKLKDALILLGENKDVLERTQERKSRKKG